MITRKLSSLTVLTVIGACLWFTPVATAADVRGAVPGPTIVIRDSGVDEGTFVAPRQPLVPSAKVKTATFDVTYTGFTAEAQAAFQAAVDVWSTLITSPVPIEVDASWEEFEEENVIGQARATWWWSFVGAEDVYFPSALADARTGRNVNDENPDTAGDPDIVATFASNFDDWYFGTDGNTPFGKVDFMSVVLHELCHGLGFSGSAVVDEMTGTGSWGFGPDSWKPYDFFVEDGSGTAITDADVYPNESTELAEALQGGDLWWGGSEGITAAGGMRPRLYAPSEWEEGSSYSHLNESTYPAGDRNSLMTYQIGRAEAIHDPGPITLGMFRDIGWSASENFTYWVAASALVSSWRTSLGIFNTSSASATVDVRFIRSNGRIFSRTLTLPARNQRVIANVVNFVGSSGTGTIQVVSDQPLVVGSRTFSQGEDGTFGQYLDGALPSDGIGAGQSVWLTMLEETSNFRTNIGFTNTGTSDARVTVTLFDSSGIQLVTFSVTVGPGLNKQDNQPYLRRAGRSNITAGTALVTVDTGSGVLVYGSVVDQRTEDPTTIPPKM